jgi:hypothetical protein
MKNIGFLIHNSKEIIMFKIMAKWNNNNVEEIDTADTKEEAEYLLGEYKMAFGLSCSRIWIEG